MKNEKQYEALKDKGMSKERAAKIANSPDASSKRWVGGWRSLYLPWELAICRSMRCVNGRTIAIGSRASQKLKSR